MRTLTFATTLVTAMVMHHSLVFTMATVNYQASSTALQEARLLLYTDRSASYSAFKRAKVKEKNGRWWESLSLVPTP